MKIKPKLHIKTQDIKQTKTLVIKIKNMIINLSEYLCGSKAPVAQLHPNWVMYHTILYF
jgi:hypothetical protein